MDIVGRLPLPVGALRGRGGSRRDAARRTAAATSRQPVRAASDVLRRERHQPDYSILLAVVALSAIGILMVFSL